MNLLVATNCGVSSAAQMAQQCRRRRRFPSFYSLRSLALSEVRRVFGEYLFPAVALASVICGAYCLTAQAQSLAGDALQFNGTNQCVVLPSLDLSAAIGITLEAWVKPSDFANERYRHIIRQDGWSPDWVLGFFEYGTILAFGVSTQVGHVGYRELKIPIVPSDYLGVWHHIAATYDGESRKVYRDGVLLAGAPQNGPLSFVGGPHAIAGVISAWGAGLQYVFAGRIDEVRIWDLARSEAEINQTMHTRLLGTEPGLVGYWRFDEGVGLRANDASGHGRNGSLSNAPIWVISDAPIGQSIAVTMPASDILAESASLNGFVAPQGKTTAFWFEYGQGNDVHVTSAQSAGSGFDSTPVSQRVSGLLPDTVFHFRCVVSNEAGLFAGYEKQFKTAGRPTALTLPPPDLSVASAVIAGKLNPNGLTTSAWFEWGTNADYGNATVSQVLGPAFTNLVVTNIVSGLAAGTEYHYRFIATNSSGTSLGQGIAFRTHVFSNSFSGDYYMSTRGFVVWGDYDRNGESDLLVLSGPATNGATILYQNESGTFKGSSYSWWLNGALPALEPGSADWGDFNNDGAIDLLLTGQSSGYFGGGAESAVVCNDGSWFTNLNASIPVLARGAGSWADYDNDGNLDFVLTGATGGYYPDWTYRPTNILYHNNGDGTFTDTHAGLLAVFDSSVAWGDYDNDGQLDLLIAGNTGSGCETRLYHNIGGSFIETPADLTGVASGSAAWGDLDGDGWLDILLVGTTNNSSTGAVCLVYHNNRDSTFTEIGANLPGVYLGGAAWGDYDNDGQLDILITGIAPSFGTPAARVYRNHNGIFTDIGAGLPLFTYGNGAWSDYDNDGRLDVATVGYLGFWPDRVSVFRNHLNTTNTALVVPAPPGGFQASVTNDCVSLRWSAGKDARTPTPGLTYNYRLGTTPGGVDIVAPEADPATGYRRVPAMGNAEHRLFAYITNLPPGVCYWNVQTINNGFVGSAWGDEQAFTVPGGHPQSTTLAASNVLCCSALLSGSLNPRGYSSRAWFDWGTTTNLGNATPVTEVGAGVTLLPLLCNLMTLSPYTTYYFRLTVTNVGGVAMGQTLSFVTQGPPPAIATLAATNIGYYDARLLGSSPFFTPAGDRFFEWGRTSAYGHVAPAVVIGSALAFDGYAGLVEFGWGEFPEVTNNFTIELWANPTADRQETAESTTGIPARYGQRLAIFPEEGARAYGDPVHAGAGLSIGTNGISVIEHTDYYFPAVLVHTGSISGWTHVALVYRDHEPELYLNGTLMRNGLASEKMVHPSADLGLTAVGAQAYWYGPYAGWLQDVRIWAEALDTATIRQWMERSLGPDHPAYSHLVGYWPLNEGIGNTVSDSSPRHNPGQMQNGVEWSGGRGYAETLAGAWLYGLTPGTTYHFRAVATNAGGTVYGADSTFTTLPLPRVTSVSWELGKTMSLQFSGLGGLNYDVQTSTNLVNWDVLTNLISEPDGSFDLLDITAADFPARFYRLRVR